MLLDRQRALLTVVATLAFASALIVNGLAAREVRIKTAQISMAEETVRAVSNFRYLTMEVALYGEARAEHQWARRHASVTRALEAHQYSERAENLLLEREKANLAVLDRLFKRLTAGNAATPDGPPRQTDPIVSALFLTTQDMLDDGFDLMRLNRLGLEAAQRRAIISAIASLCVLVLLIGLASLTMKRRVLQPVAALQRLTEQVIKGQLDARLNLMAPNEIGMLGRSFDNMTEQLQQSQQAMAGENAERRRAQGELEASVAALARKSDELARAQEALQTFIDHTPALVMYWDTKLRNRFANRAYLEWFGQSPQQIRGRHIADVIGPERFFEIEARLRSVLAGHREIFERRLTIPGGEVRDALFSYIPDIQDNEVRGMYGFVSDISPLKRAEAGQQAALLQLQAVLDAASDFAIVQTDLNGTIKLFSAGAERMLGYAAADVVDRHQSGIFHVSEEVARRAAELSLRFGRPVGGFEAFVAVACEGGSESLEWTFVRKDGGTLPVNLTVTAVRDGQGRIAGFLRIAKDIRAERESRQVLADARDLAEQANLAKSQFLANMSHEIRTPMNAVLGMLELLQHTALSPLQADYARKSESAARSLLELLNDILDFSQVEANKLELESASFRVEGLMRDLSVILSSLVGNKEVELIFAIDPAIAPLLRGDATRLRQILINLASNAIKFTDHGEVTVTLGLKYSGAQGIEVEFIVADSGIGIARDKLATIFDGFTQAESSTTRRFGGTGLGLTISQRLVGLMKGHLSVESSVGVGSRFAFSVLFEHPTELELRAEAESGCPHAPMNVLVVDDNRLAREGLMAMLSSFGWSGACAAGGEQALALLAGAPPFDVVLVDWRMPGMDGWELAQRIRQHANTTPIIVMVTAHGRNALAERLQSERNLLNGFLTKPVTPAMLRDAMCNAEAGRSIDALPTAQARSAPRVAGLRLLVVDDNPMNQQIARELLLREGALVDVAGGGALALELAASAVYDAILMDIQMPDMDGYACTRALRATPANRATPVIAMTANVMNSDREACLAAGMNDHVGKPIAIDAMVNAILLHCQRLPLGLSAPAAAPARIAPLAIAGGGAIELGPALERLGGNAELYVALADTYAGEAAQFVPALRAALAQPASMAGADILHTFKSAAGIVGASTLQTYAADLEAGLRAGVTLDLEHALAQLDALVAASINELERTTRTLAASLAPAPSGPAAPLADLLRALDGLLAARDMAALGVLTAIDSAYGNTLGDALAPLAHCIDVLDFAKAGRECGKLLAEIA
jgi:PAS domain S-box-containing protein